MKRNTLIIIGIILLAAAVAGFFYWRCDRRRLNVLFDDAEHIVVKPAGKAPHEGVLKYSRIDEIAAPEVTIVFSESGFQKKLSREDLKTYLMAAHKSLKYLDVKSGERNFVIKDDKANFSFLADLSFEANSGYKEQIKAEISGSAVKIDGKWFISEIRIK